MLFIFLLLLVASIFADDPYNCTGTQTINPPANISTPVIYPATWNPSNDAPQYASGQSCSWIVNVPKGMYALLQIKATTNESTTLQVTDSTGYVTIIQLADMEPFFLMDPSFRIDLQVNKIGNFGMRIRWSIVQNASSTSWRTRQRSSPHTMFGLDFDNVTTIEADTRVNLLTLSPTRISPDSSRLLRNTQVYDGNSIEAKHVGNLYQIHQNGARFVSTGKYLTLRSLLPGYYAVGNGVIVQDYEDVKPFHSYKAINCIMEAPCDVILDATNGTAAAIRYSDEVIYVRSIKMTETNKISVYTDFVTDAHKLTDYLSTNINTTIPQQFNGQFTTFVLDKDHAIVSLTSDCPMWTSGFGGRRGFMTSPNYAIYSNNQNFEDKIYSTSSKSSKISFYIDKAWMPYGATTILILRDRNTVFNATYSLENLPEDSTISAIGDMLSVQYQLNPTVSSKGIYISFGFDENGSAGPCVPTQTNIVLFAYSTDIDYTTFRLGAQNLVRYTFLNKKLANVRFDTTEEEEIEYHTDNKSFNASIFSHPPDSSLGYGDNTTGSNLYTVLKKFLNNKQFSTCGATVVILVKRYPNESNVSDIIRQLRANHILVHITVDSIPSGGSNSGTLFEMSSKTNGYCVFASGYDLIFAFQNMGGLLYTPYQFIAQNFVVTGSGTIELPVFKTPIPEGWVQWTRVVITVQDHTLDNSFVSVNYTIASTDGVVAYQFPNDHADRRHGTGQADLVASNGTLHYKWTIDYQYSTNTPQIIECRMYSDYYHDFLPLPDY